MSFSNRPFSSPISEQDDDDFLAAAVKRFKGNCFIAFKDVHWEFNVAVDRVNSDPKNPSMIDVLQEASEAGNNPSSIITRTQLPILDASNKVPGNTMIGIYGFSAYYPVAGIPQTEAAALALQSVIDTCQRSIITFETAGNVFYELDGRRLFNFGSGFNATPVGAAGADGFIAVPLGVDRGIRVPPVMLSNEEQLKLKWFYDRQAAWPAIARPRFVMHTKIATAN